MIKKCCVHGCDTNYGPSESTKKNKKNEKSEAEIIEEDSGNNKNKISVSRFPKDENGREI